MDSFELVLAIVSMSLAKHAPFSTLSICYFPLYNEGYKMSINDHLSLDSVCMGGVDIWRMLAVPKIFRLGEGDSGSKRNIIHERKALLRLCGSSFEVFFICNKVVLDKSKIYSA